MHKKKLLFIIAGLVVILLLAPLLIPTSSYLQQVERIASEKTGQPVVIGSLRLAILPTPRVNIGDFRIGKDNDLTVASIAVLPEISSLFSAQKVLSSVNLEHVTVKKSALDLLSAMPASQGPAALLVRKVSVQDLQLMLDGQPAMNVDLGLGGENKLETAKLTTSDGKLNVLAKPAASGTTISLNAQQWVLPVGVPVKFDSLVSEMTLQGSHLNVSSLEAGLYQGTLSATADLDWSKALQLGGKFKTKNIEVGDASRLFSPKPLLSGRLGGDGDFKAVGKENTALADQLVLNYAFDINKGVLHGVDLAKAATMLLRSNEQGGETQFDELKGVLHTSGKQVEVKSLKVASGLLAANGNVKMSPTKQLSGIIEVELKKGVALVAVPLEVSGTVDKPSIQPTKVALAGAAVGTGVLGPGVGTALGVKAATGVEKLKGLFGGKK